MTEQDNMLNEWLTGRPQAVKDMAYKVKPWYLYRLKPTGQHCSIYSYSEDGTVTISIEGHDSEALDTVNKIIGFNVFGIEPQDLEIIRELDR